MTSAGPDIGASGGRTSSSATPPAPVVMRRALVVWGSGHLALGDRRGWVLLALQVLSVVFLVVLASAFLEGSRAFLVFLALAVFFAAWGGQAVDAQRKAVAAGGSPGGAIQLLALAPVVGIVMTGFWLVAGSSGSPEATLQRYVLAWQDRRADLAAQLFVSPPAADALAVRWAQQEAYLRDRLGELSASGGGGPEAGIDPERPFRSLVVTLPDQPRLEPDIPGTEADRVTAYLEIVRPVRRETTFLGIFPAARQEMVPVERVGRAVLRAVPLEPRTGLGRENRVWRLESVEVGGP